MHIDDQGVDPGTSVDLVAQPLVDIHLKSPKMTKERVVHGDERKVRVLGIVAGIILLMAWMNYINLTTSKSLERSKEIGLRRVSGASKRLMVAQFIFEAMLVKSVALVLSLIILIIALPYFNKLVGLSVNLALMDLLILREPAFWISSLGVVLIGGIVIGMYPGIVASSFTITGVVKTNFLSSKLGFYFRQTVIGVQYAACVGLMILTLGISDQVRFMKNTDPGYFKDQLLIIKAPLIVDSTFDRGLAKFRAEVERYPSVLAITSTSEVPGAAITQMNSLRNMGDGAEDNFVAYHMEIDENFVDTYGVKIVAGRNYSKGEPFSRDAVSNPLILNEEAVRRLGFKSASEVINKGVYFGWGEPDHKGNVVGVLSNYHQRSLQESYDPMIFLYVPNLSNQYTTLKILMVDSHNTIESVRKIYEKSFFGSPFDWFFLDEFFNRQYRFDQQFEHTFAAFSVLALGVSILGILGLSAFMIAQKSKEIAIRTVLGAGPNHLARLFSSDFLKVIVIVSMGTAPIAVFGLRQWLDTFAFRTTISASIVILPIVCLMLITVLTILVQIAITLSKRLVISLRTD